jgi:hypothetical protein
MNRTIDPEVVAAQGRALYEKTLRAALEPKETGRYVVLNVETGAFELGDDAITPSEKMRERFPGTLFYALRVGYPAMLHRGGSSQRRTS